MRLIDADKLHLLLRKYTSDANSYDRGWDDAVFEIAEHMPTIDAVGVVRCENCKWCYDGYCSRFDDLIPFGHESYEWRDYYCSYGEKKENGTD